MSALALAACSSGKDASKAPKGPVKVGFVVMQPSNVLNTIELAGRVSALQESEVRPQVSGIIRKRFFTEGGLVQAGQPLYQIEADLYRAAYNQAEANLNSALASAEAARQKAERYRPLAAIEAVSKQDYTDAAAQARQAQAGVSQSRAALETARINLRYTTVPAPISGRIGRSLFTEGALVTSAQASPLAVIQRMDPVYVDIQQSSAELLSLRRALANGGLAPVVASVRLKLEDGSEYEHTGTLGFSEMMVNQNTGTVTLRAKVPNPQGLLLPGMFVRATFAQSIDTRAFLVPQQAVVRNARGAAYVYLAGKDGKAVKRDVTAQRTQGAFWVITKGLAAGDKLIVQGIGNLKPDAEIAPVPANAPQKVAPPKPGAGAAGASGKGN